MEALTSVMVAVLAGVVIHLWLQLRHYQRVDYAFLVDQEERERRTASRLKALEALVTDLTQYDALRRAELAELLSASQAQLEQQAAQLREMLVAAANAQAALAPAGIKSAKPDATAGEVEFPTSSREHAIRIQLARGLGSAQIAAELGLSLAEVELVRAKQPRQASA